MKKIIIICLLTISLNVYSQGCSDAGFCSLMNTTPQTSLNNNKYNTIRVGVGYGSTNNSVTVITPFIEYSSSISKKIAINTRFDMRYSSSDTVDYFDISDIYLTGDMKFVKNVTLTTGFKLPLNKSDRTEGGEMLPMDFQSSLGTFDFLFSLKYQKDALTLSSGWQQPLSQNNNTFVKSSIIQGFHSTNRYYRNSDLWFRGAYKLDLDDVDQFKFTPSALAIFHLYKDNYRNNAGEIYYVNGTGGLTFNVAGQLDYFINDYSAIGFNIAFPLINRDVIIDGTGRQFQTNLDYRISF